MQNEIAILLAECRASNLAKFEGSEKLLAELRRMSAEALIIEMGAELGDSDYIGAAAAALYISEKNPAYAPAAIEILEKLKGFLADHNDSDAYIEKALAQLKK